LVERGVAVLVASGSVAAILAAKAATKTIPIVFGFGADPIETGLVSSLDHPGGNITGITSMTMGMGSKRLALLPRAARVAVLVDPSEDATVVNSMIADVRGAAISMGRDIEVFYAGNIGDIDTAFANLVEKRSEVLLVSPAASFPASGWRS
jgi:putative tryptophan/tyrosine transport system substrate-binding protein